MNSRGGTGLSAVSPASSRRPRRRAMLNFLRSVFSRSHVDCDLDDEIKDHLARDIESRVQRGIPPREARRQALAEFGGIDNVRERLRDEHGISLSEDIARDARFAWRRLGRN